MDKREYCYWCGKPATSKEHVPPKCFFPENKDMNGIYEETFRHNLITVPSCIEHNIRKSNDDEYLMACLSGLIGNNGVSYVHSKTKVRRAVSRNPKLLDVKSEDILEVSGTKYPVIWIDLDNHRLIYSFEAITRALYFHEFKNSFSGECKIFSKIFYNLQETNASNFQIRTIKLIEDEQQHWKTEVKGSNPKIFTYQFGPVDGFGNQILYLNFYEHTRVYIILYTKLSNDKKKYEEQLKAMANVIMGDLYDA